MGGLPSKPDYTRQFEVLGAGYSRTGTLSLQIALERLLGGPVLHGATGLLNRPEFFIRNWTLALQAKNSGDKETCLKLVKENMRGYVGCTDVPPVVVVAELLELYPDAKVILVTRNPETWWRSFGAILDLASAWYLTPLTIISPSLRWWPRFLREWQKVTDDLMCSAGGKPGVYGPQLLKNHNDMIKQLVPPERLLIMQLSDGWEPLCKFLGKPIPEEPFPHVNDAATADRVSAGVVARLLAMWIATFSVVGGSAYLAYRILQ